MTRHLEAFVVYHPQPSLQTRWVGDTAAVGSCRSSPVCPHTSLRFDSVNPELLGMDRVISEDATRRVPQINGQGSGHRLARHAAAQVHRIPAVAGSWILATDTTVKCLYGKQEGAVPVNCRI